MEINYPAERESSVLKAALSIQKENPIKRIIVNTIPFYLNVNVSPVPKSFNQGANPINAVAIFVENRTANNKTESEQK